MTDQTDHQTGLGIIDRTMRQVLPGQCDSRAARVMLLAIGAQESRFAHRVQIGGPAHGYWQFELGGVRGVLGHASTRALARACCILLDVEPSAVDVYAALAHNDLLACTFARLLLWTDPTPLPEVGDAAGAWDYYLRNWRPGKPRSESWARLYADAAVCVAVTR